jgi:glycerate kinase
MKIVLAFDSFKGSLSAPEACLAAARGLARLPVAPTVIHCPLSDGGEGFAEAMCRSGQGESYTLEVTGPLFRLVQAQLVLLDGGQTAVVESAQACGLGLVPSLRRSPLDTTSTGVGELVLAALARGAHRLIIGLGGSATTDAGIGMLTALGWQFLDAHGQAALPTGAALAEIQTIIPGPPLPVGVELFAACDVTNPLYGAQGAAYVYGPQKGATEDDVRKLDQGLRHFAAVAAPVLGTDLSAMPGAGAAGGLGFALLACLHGQFRSGAALAIELSRLPDHLQGADLCLTGEGRSDGQTAAGKLPAAVIASCRQAGVRCVCLSGALGPGWSDLYAIGASAVLSICPGPQTLAEAIAHTADALADAAEAVGRLG